MGTRRSTEGDLTSRYWDEAAARRVLGEWGRSGKSMAEFARERGIKQQRLSWWRRRMGGAAKERVSAPVGVELAPAIVTERVARVRVRLDAGIEIEVADVAALPASWVAAIARELARP